MNFDWILFDADETLFDFDSRRGIQLMLEQNGKMLTDKMYDKYQKVNKPLWVDYQNGVITAAELKHHRFKEWADELNVTPEKLNSDFMQVMGDICLLLPGAKELIDYLSGKVKLGIVTNGFTDLQSVRLEKTGLASSFEHVFISEEIGVAKPDRRIFDHALSMMGNPDKERVMMVGDNPHSDVLGGLNAGIMTCWLNRDKSSAPDGFNAHWEVNSLTELKLLFES
ncbi:pyrimidine 5'-nucleotidase [Vibrio sp. JC009]|uniref:pyrimidine 5'-nucleotidase n=1 Tax=Vibrio sp. JC009 TaxID=2912314 RepID=UPI0023B1B004|nr:pyrimidine 5'-nucleotidase [Vibrio sp. JC009]WED24120.1 pyrimidine 5'-nucleotidase [Vibrio sp. JC009]